MGMRAFHIERFDDLAGLKIREHEATAPGRWWPWAPESTG